MSTGDVASGDALHPVPLAVRAAEAVRVMVTELQAAEVWPCGDAELASLIGLLEEIERRTASVRLATLAQMQARGTASSLGAASTAAWVRTATNARPGRTHAEVAVADALSSRYPQVRAALAVGAASADQVAACVRALDALPDSVEAGTRERAEAFLVDQCASFDPVALGRLGKRLLHVLDPDGPELLEQDEQAARRRREVRLTERDGGLALKGWLDAESAAVLTTALDPLCAPRTGEDGQDRRTPAQRRADALVDLARRCLDAGDLPTQRGERPHVTVTMDLNTLLAATAEAQPAMLDRGGPLSAEAARRLACDAQLVPVVLGGAGQPLDVGRSTRAVPTPIRRALVARDGGCAFPGCDRPAAWADAHHIVHWSDGGTTSLENLVLLCGHHHRVIHHTAWSVRIDPSTADPSTADPSSALPRFTPPATAYGPRGRGVRALPGRADLDRQIRQLPRAPDD